MVVAAALLLVAHSHRPQDAHPASTSGSFVKIPPSVLQAHHCGAGPESQAVNAAKAHKRRPHTAVDASMALQLVPWYSGGVDNRGEKCASTTTNEKLGNDAFSSCCIRWPGVGSIRLVAPSGLPASVKPREKKVNKKRKNNN